MLVLLDSEELETPMTRTEANALVLYVLPMCHALVQRWAGRWPQLHDDLVQSCVVVLLEHAHQFDPARGSPTTWAWQWIRSTVFVDLGMLGLRRSKHQHWSEGRFALAKAKSLQSIPAGLESTTLEEMTADGASPIDDVVAAREELAIALRFIDRKRPRGMSSRFTSEHLLMLGECGDQTEVSLAAGVSRQRVEQIRDAVVAELRRTA